MCSLAEVQRPVDGMETTRDMDATSEEFQRASQRVRKALAKLRQALRENGADTHLLIVRPRRRTYPGIHVGAAVWLGRVAGWRKLNGRKPLYRVE